MSLWYATKRLFIPPKSERYFAHRIELLKKLPAEGKGAEIGTWRGQFAEHMIEIARPRELHLIDPWMASMPYPGSLHKDPKLLSQADMDAVAADVTARFAADPRVHVHRMSSDDFFRVQQPASFDWFYIDGDHAYEFVLSDLKQAWPLLKAGGVLAGDDYRWRDPQRGQRTVQRAVREFAAANGASYQVVGKHQYFFIKPQAS